MGFKLLQFLIATYSKYFKIDADKMPIKRRLRKKLLFSVSEVAPITLNTLTPTPIKKVLF